MENSPEEPGNPDKPDDPQDLMRSVIARTKHLERRVAGGSGKSDGPSSPGWSRLWQLLRRLTERFSHQLEERFQAGAAEPADPEWQRRKRELQSRGLRTDALLHDLDLRQEQVNREWRTAFGELERLREDWRNLQDQVSTKAPGSPGVRLHEQLARLELLWTEVLQEDSTALREREAFSSIWRRLVGGLLPRLEKGVQNIEMPFVLDVPNERSSDVRYVPSSAPQAGDLWLALARRLRDLDRRWRGYSGNLRREVAQEENMELAERLAQEEARSRQMSLRLLESLRRQQELESLVGAEESDAQSRLLSQVQTIENLQQDCHRLAKELQEAVGQRDANFRRRNLYKKTLRRRWQAWQEVRDQAAAYLEKMQSSGFELKSTQNELASIRGTQKDVEFLQHSLQRKMEEAEAALQSHRALQEQRDMAAKEAAEIRLEKKKLKSELAGIDLERKKLASELQAVRASKEMLQQQRNQLATERDAARLGLNRAGEGLTAAKTTEQALRAERERLIQELGASHLQLAALHQQLASVRKEMDLLKAEMQKMQEAAESAEIQRAAQAGVPALSTVASTELESMWMGVMEMLLKPLMTAHAHLRRLALGALPEGHRAVVSLAYTSVGQAQDFLKMLEVFFAVPTAPPVPSSLQSLVGAVARSWEPAFHQRNSTIVLKFDPGPDQIQFHPEPLRVAIYQIIRNAYEAMPRGGCLTIRLWREKETRETGLSFSDTGPGFSPLVLKSLFAGLVKGKSGHLGLGLLLAKKVVARLGGKIAAQNAESGRGAVVAIKFSSPLNSGDAMPPLI